MPEKGYKIADNAMLLNVRWLTGSRQLGRDRSLLDRQVKGRVGQQDDPGSPVAASNPATCSDDGDASSISSSGAGLEPLDVVQEPDSWLAAVQQDQVQAIQRLPVLGVDAMGLKFHLLSSSTINRVFKVGLLAHCWVLYNFRFKLLMCMSSLYWLVVSQHLVV